MFLGSIWGLYGYLHLGYLLHIWKPQQPGLPESFDEAMYQRGIIHAVVSQLLTFMLMLNFVIVFSTDPGSVPETAEWTRPVAHDEDRLALQRTSEVKQDGLPRYCKWCECYKPDRCHHCRVCRSCILRMDHHCPWIANCVGFGNHKFFLLLVFYALLACLFIACTMTETLQRALIEETTFVRRFMVVFTMTLASMMSTLLMLFLSLHLWLTLRATTTIEFCEKAYKRNGASPNQASIYDIGFYENVKSVLGPYPVLWLLPWGLPEGEGLQFPVNPEAKNAIEQQRRLVSSRSSSQSQGCADERLQSIPEVTGHRASQS
eukprot:TRINITY_DN23189_c0_g1_i1.p1 TRINITY_DN23189_c0_g1~~TRINITY_DN23189_c0_g1_i1.p1  ORF type:complete len:318 (-),score=31.27 TRINITY_DN23189_c0_g1_i1:285-1238(-)